MAKKDLIKDIIEKPTIKMECKICWWVYDPDMGDEVMQIPPHTPFSQLPDYWHCPICDNVKEGFLEMRKE